MKRTIVWLSLLLLPASGAAQQPAAQPAAPEAAEAPGAVPTRMPKGPAELIGGARKAQREREMQEAASAAPSTTPQPAAPTNPHAAMGADASAGGQPPRALSAEQVDQSLPVGTIRVRVIDQHDAPVHDQQVLLGVMKPDGSRSELEGKTGADGIATFEKLDVGERQAYRVNVPYAGARFSSNPFRLPPRGGYEVMLRRLPVTRSEKDIVLYVGATSIELKDERLKIVQQVRLYNIGGEAYVFPEEGKLVRLPEGFTAVQSQDTMTDQKVVGSDDGVRISGSLLPGEVTLLWGFDLPVSGSTKRFTVEVPWTTFAYRVVSDAPEGLTLQAEGFPAATIEEDRGRRFWVTELRRRVGDAPFGALKVRVEGIPGPGPMRWIASGIALFAILLGLVFAARRDDGRVGEQHAAALAQRKARLLQRGRELQAKRDAGEVGPEFHKEQTEALVNELSALLYEEAKR